MRGVKTLAVVLVLFAMSLTASSQCGSIEMARSAIVELAMMELQTFQEAFGVSFDLYAAQISTHGDLVVVSIPVVEPYGGFYPGDVVAGFVVRGHPSRSDGGYALQLGDYSTVYVIGSSGENLRAIPVCDSRFGNCDPMPSVNVLPIARFRSQASEEENCCYVGYVICHGTPPHMTCEESASWTCPCPDD